MLSDFTDPNEVPCHRACLSGAAWHRVPHRGLGAVPDLRPHLHSSPGFGGQGFCWHGGLALWMADKMRRATAGAIELTPTNLRDNRRYSDRRVEDIIGLESRAVFAFQAFQRGFLLADQGSDWRRRVWRPCVYGGRIGRRVGIWRP